MGVDAGSLGRREVEFGFQAVVDGPANTSRFFANDRPTFGQRGLLLNPKSVYAADLLDSATIHSSHATSSATATGWPPLHRLVPSSQ